MSGWNRHEPWNEPDPPKWYEAYQHACFEIGCEPISTDLGETGRSEAIKHMECAIEEAERALEGM